MSAGYVLRAVYTAYDTVYVYMHDSRVWEDCSLYKGKCWELPDIPYDEARETKLQLEVLYVDLLRLLKHGKS